MPKNKVNPFNISNHGLKGFSEVSLLVALSLALSGCSAKNKTTNTGNLGASQKQAYTAKNFYRQDNKVTLILSFSGGGTRAAALSYGVLQALRDTDIEIDGERINLLEEVDMISSVSGGSFTAAYYGLYGDKIFEDYEEAFLYHEVSEDLISILLSPSYWFSYATRTDKATDYYDDNIFGDSTFADIRREGAPYIVINATDISTGSRFSFTQEYFDLICSDLNSYSVSSSVTASSAVPFVFTPVVLENKNDCDKSDHLQPSFEATSYRNRNLIKSLESYSHKDEVNYLHLVDGGITDNLGLLSVYEMSEYLRFNDKEELQSLHKNQSARPIVIISVDASTSPESGIRKSIEAPSMKQTVDVITDIQLHRYNDTTKDLIVDELQSWSELASHQGHTVSSYFIEISPNKSDTSAKRYLLNQIPTDFMIDKANVDLLIKEGNKQLIADPEFQNFLSFERKK
ncbi:patatin-like phospholipase family protein [Vibrio sp. Sgm 22]|uniref:patatin-like phospholipase family protein n=1 Tax=unclassified Vibrio TaxID=2614977 RepID=UPI002248882E|nr:MULTISPECIES: patatin-like phospholipase family protein [unclassified Vibrio]MCX2757686.1 patatin-like phospholipase family protein [Vibrio sp. 14G-20]MCX2775036.1 patatin-like phospholipase family protein [Vibrio sp. Sgm 22]